MHSCNVCCCTSSKSMTTHYGLKVCSMGCALRVFRFASLISPMYKHDDIVMTDSYLPKKCNCGCKMAYFPSDNVHLTCKGGKRHCVKDRVVDLTEEELKSEKYAKHCIYKCMDCDTGLSYYQKVIIDEQTT